MLKMSIPKGKVTIALAVAVFGVFVLLFYYVADAGHDEPRLIIIGDSLSTTHESWPNYLRGMAPRWNIHVMAQNGRTVRDFSIPRDLWTNGTSNETVVYFLGSNDILQKYDVAHARYRLQTHIDFLLDRQFKVLLIVPPTLDMEGTVHSASTSKHRELFESYRGTRQNLWVYDMDLIWDSSDTPDGVHPNASLSWKMAWHINIVLSMNIY